MRITRELLLKLATQTVEERVRSSRDVMTVYLIGSLLGDQPLLGGCTDIDLVFVHTSAPLKEHEIVPISPEVHLDIAHHSQSLYNHPRHLREHPWLGAAIYANPLLLHDTQHWFEFTQSSVGAQFYRPDYVMVRARQQAEEARRLWADMQSGAASPNSNAVHTYLRSVGAAANAVSILSGEPLTERRFLMLFPERAEAIHRPGLAAGLLDLLGGETTEPELLRSWLPHWEAALQAVGQAADFPTRLDPARLAYYQRGIAALLENDPPLNALWPLLTTWSLAMDWLPPESPHHAAWEEARAALHLEAASFSERLSSLDAYLDNVEETLDAWAQENGA